MTRTTPRLLRSLLAALVAAASLVALVGTAAPAGAATPDTSYLIAWGNDQQVIDGASATVSRITDAEHDVITVSFVVPDGFDESHLCVSFDEAFSERHPPGQCDHKTEATKGETVTTGEYVFQVPTGPTVYLQLHIVVGQETAYAAWTPGGPFHGNIEVPPVPVTPTPVGCPGDMVPEGGVVEVDPVTGEPTNCVSEEDEVVVAITCPDGSTPMVDRNGDGAVDSRDCVATSVLPEVVVPRQPVNAPAVPPLAPIDPSTPVQPAIPAQPASPVQPVVATPLAPAPTVDVLPADEVAPTVVTVDNPQVTAVLGDQVVAGTLPRTGAATPGLAAFGALLLGAGLVLTRTGRRFA